MAAISRAAVLTVPHRQEKRKIEFGGFSLFSSAGLKKDTPFARDRESPARSFARASAGFARALGEATTLTAFVANYY
jgi:hypothetical protein